MSREVFGPCECEWCPCVDPSPESTLFICDACARGSHQPGADPRDEEYQSDPDVRHE